MQAKPNFIVPLSDASAGLLHAGSGRRPYRLIFILGKDRGYKKKNAPKDPDSILEVVR